VGLLIRSSTSAGGERNLSEITAYIDADFAEDVTTRKSVSGIAIYLE
jgi:hypothetical protein